MPDDSIYDNPALAGVLSGGATALDPTKVAGLQSIAQGALTRATQSRQEARKTYGDSVQDTLRAIDDATKSLREAHTSPDRWNLPLLAFGAGMLRTQPGVQSNFFNELGNGLAATTPVIQQQRMTDEDFWRRMADLKAQRGQIAAEPSKLDYTQSQKDEIEARKTLSQLSIAGARLEKPMNLPDGTTIFRDPKNPGMFVVRRYDGRVERFDPSTGKTTEIAPDDPSAAPPSNDGAPAAPPAPAVVSPPGDGAMPGAPPAAAPPPGAPPAADPNDPNAWIKANVRPEHDPSKMNEGINWAKFAEIARKNPREARKLYKALMYEDDPLVGLSTHGSLKANERQRIESLLTQVDPTWSYTDLQQAVKNANDPKWVGQGSTKAQLNTVMGHMEELLHAYEKMGNADPQVVNKIKNKVMGALGFDETTAQSVSAKFVADETAKYLSGAGGSALADREQLERLFSGNASPQQALETLRTVMALTSKKGSELAGIRQEAMKNRRKMTLDDVLSPEAKKSRDMIGGTVIAPWEGGKPKMFVPGVTKVGGMTYKGGDPKNKDSWE